MIELFKILEGMTPDYLSELFVKADNPYDTRDKCKLIQPLKRTTTYGLRSFQYYGAHVWNMLPINIKAAQSLHDLNLSSDHGQGRHVHVIFALLYYKKCHSCVLNTSLSVWRLCDRLWHRGLVSRQPAVPPALSVRWGFRHWRHWRFSIMKISSAASGASSASRWLQLCPGEQHLSLRWD